MAARTEKGIAGRSVYRGRPADGAIHAPEADEVVVEEPLEIRVAGDPMSMTMRTPGQDRELALGFLLAEGVIGSLADVGYVGHCGRPGEEGFGNVIDVTPAPGVVLDPERLARTRRGTLTTAACGVCGRRSIDDLMARRLPAEDRRTVPFDVLAGSTERMRSAQRNFARTGGIHAAAALDAAGELRAAHEDVGRHNAVDKVLGTLLDQDAGATAAGGDAAVLVVSGRISFEMAQKAVAGNLIAVAGVSAPTSLAIDLAERAGLVLAGFVRRGRINVYTHPDKVSSGS